HRHREGLPTHGAGVDDPARALAPGCVAGVALAVQDLAGRAGAAQAQLRPQAQRERPLLGVAQLELAGAGHQRQVEIDGAPAVAGGEVPRVPVAAHLLAHAVAPDAGRAHRARRRVDRDVARLDAALAGPEVDAVDVAVREPEALVVRVVGRLAGD